MTPSMTNIYPIKSNTKDRQRRSDSKEVKTKKYKPNPIRQRAATQRKKEKQNKKTTIKALVDTGASESIITLKAAKHLPMSNKTETKNWSTAAGMLNTSQKTKKELNLGHLNCNQKGK